MENINEKKTTTTYSARVSEELKNRLTDTLAKSKCISTSDFFEKMLNHFQIAENLKPKRRELEDVEKALLVISRAVEGLSAAVENVENEKQVMSSTHAHENSIAAEDMELLQSRVSELEGLWSSAIKEQDGKIVEIEKLNDSLSKEVEKSKSLEIVVSELNVVVKEFERKVVENDKEIKRLRSMENMVEDVRRDAKESKEALKITDKALKVANDANVVLNEELRDALKRLEQANFETEKAILATEKTAFEQRKADLTELDKLRRLVNATTNIDSKQTPMENVIQSIGEQAPKLVDDELKKK